MIKKALEFFCCIIIASSFFVKSFAAQYTVNTPISEPNIDNSTMAYMVTQTYLILWYYNDFTTTYTTSSASGNTYISDPSCRLELHEDSSVENKYYLKFFCSSSNISSIPVTYFQFKLSDGSLYTMGTYNVPSSSFITGYNVYTWQPLSAFSYSNIVLSSDLRHVPSLMQINWNYDSQVNSNVQTIIEYLGTIREYSYEIYSQDNQYYRALQEFYTDFFATSWEDATIWKNWDYFLAEFNNYAYNSHTFYRNFNDWYINHYVLDHEEEMTKLDEIISIIEGGSNSPTYSYNEATTLKDKLNEYESLENQYVRDFTPELSAAADQVNGQNGIFLKGTVPNALAFCKYVLETFIFSAPYYSALVVFVVVMGIAVLVIGRRI